MVGIDRPFSYYGFSLIKYLCDYYNHRRLTNLLPKVGKENKEEIKMNSETLVAIIIVVAIISTAYVLTH